MTKAISISLALVLMSSAPSWAWDTLQGNGQAIIQKAADQYIVEM